MIQEKTMEQIAREEIQRQTLETAAQKIEAMSGNSVYQAAWRRAAQLIRTLKPG